MQESRIRIRKAVATVSVVLVVLWLLLIFGFSGSPAEASSSQSSRVAALIRSLHLEWLVPETIEGGSFEANVRKLAHMTEYAVLEFLYFMTVFQLLAERPHGKKLIISSVSSAALAFLSASLDEWHQTFVPGRAGLFSDVMIDMRGAIAGLILSLITATILHFLKKRWKRKHPAGA